MIAKAKGKIKASRVDVALDDLQVCPGSAKLPAFAKKGAADGPGVMSSSAPGRNVDGIDAHIIPVKDPEPCRNDTPVYLDGRAQSLFWDGSVHGRDDPPQRRICSPVQMEEPVDPFICHIGREKNRDFIIIMYAGRKTEPVLKFIF